MGKGWWCQECDKECSCCDYYCCVVCERTTCSCCCDFYFETKDNVKCSTCKRICDTSMFSRGSVFLCETNRDFLYNLHMYSNKDIDWVKLTQSFVRNDGDMQHYINTHVRQETTDFILSLNLMNNILSASVMEAALSNGFNFKYMNEYDIGEYGIIGVYGVIRMDSSRIEAMEVLCRKLNWIGKTSKKSIVNYVFGIYGNVVDRNRYWKNEYKVNLEYLKMHFKYDYNGRMQKIWKTFRQRVKDDMDQEVVRFMDWPSRKKRIVGLLKSTCWLIVSHRISMRRLYAPGGQIARDMESHFLENVFEKYD